MSAPLKVAVLGCWHVHAADYASRIQKHPRTELVAVWDDDQFRGQEAATQFAAPYTDDLDALLARPDVDAVTVTTSTTMHRDVMVKAAQAGKHIFTEKLLAPTVAEAEEIIRAADDNGVQLVVSLPRLYSGSTTAITEVITSGRLGRLTYGRVRLSHDGSVRNWLPDRFYDPESAIGGALSDLGCHPVYLIQLWLGSNPDTVSATYRSITSRAVEDHAVVTLGYPDQKIGVIEASFVSATPFTVEIYGTEGSLFYTDADNSISVSGAAVGADEWESISVPEHGQDVFGRWVDAIAAGERFDDNLARAVELTRLVAAANLSAAEGRTLPYPPSWPVAGRPGERE